MITINSSTPQQPSYADIEELSKDTPSFDGVIFVDDGGTYWIGAFSWRNGDNAVSLIEVLEEEGTLNADRHSYISWPIRRAPAGTTISFVQR